jgi:hypothetical protein
MIASLVAILVRAGCTAIALSPAKEAWINTRLRRGTGEGMFDYKRTAVWDIQAGLPERIMHTYFGAATARSST